jgi:hypothetical protein
MAKYPNVDYGIRHFAVLHHTGVEPAHYDFMFDTSDDSQLLTFRVEHWPLLENQAATKLRDHRRAYLAFQGVIPGDRGEVHRIDQGKVHVIETASGWLLRHPDSRPWLLLEPSESGTLGDQNCWITLLEIPQNG